MLRNWTRGGALTGLTVAFWLLVQAADARQADDIPAGLEYVPPDCVAMLSVNFEALASYDSFRGVRDRLFAQLPPPAREVATASGLTPDNISRVTVFLPELEADAPPPAPLILLTTVKPYNPRPILTAIRGQSRRGMRFMPVEAVPLPAKAEPKIDRPAAPEERPSKTPPPPPLRPGMPPLFLQPPLGMPPAPPLDLNATFIRALGDDVAIYLLTDRTALIVPVVPDSDTTVLGYLGRLLRKKPTGAMSTALKASADRRVALVAAGHGPSLLATIGRELPPQYQQSLSSVQEMNLLITAAANLEGKLSVKCADGRGATNLTQLLTTMTNQAGMALGEIGRDAKHPLAPLAMALSQTLARNKPRQDGNSVVCEMTVPPDAAVGSLVNFAQAQMRDAAGRAASSNNLKQLALGMFNYESTYGYFPAQSLLTKDGKPGLSWRVAILPFIEQEALYRQFKLDEPWDSPTNKPLIAKMPTIFAVPGHPTQEPGRTHYQVFVGPQTLYRQGDRRGPTIAQISDGTSNTLLMAEAKEPVIWTKPDDLNYDPTKPLPSFAGFWDGQVNFAFCDGSVRTLDPRKVGEKSMRALITPAGGEVISLP